VSRPQAWSHSHDGSSQPRRVDCDTSSSVTPPRIGWATPVSTFDLEVGVFQRCAGGSFGAPRWVAGMMLRTTRPAACRGRRHWSSAGRSHDRLDRGWSSGASGAGSLVAVQHLATVRADQVAGDCSVLTEATWVNPSLLRIGADVPCCAWTARPGVPSRTASSQRARTSAR
jgi:hypothetical protein